MFFKKFSSDNVWLKDYRGVWTKIGNPIKTPDYVKEQQKIIECAKNLYQKNKDKELSSQCLGVCGDYAVDIVHVPRTEEDNKIENQCEDFRLGKVSHFIELDKNGEIVRIV